MEFVFELVRLSHGEWCYELYKVCDKCVIKVGILQGHKDGSSDDFKQCNRRRWEVSQDKSQKIRSTRKRVPLISFYSVPQEIREKAQKYIDVHKHEWVFAV